MKKQLYIIMAILCAVQTVLAQNITVIDQQDLRAIPDVLIYNQNQSIKAISNGAGKVALVGFENETSIFFQHPSYETRQVSWRDLEQNNWKVSLSPKTYSLDEVVISSNRWEESQRDIIQQVSKIKARDIAFANPPTTADVIANTGQVYVQKSQLGGGSPMLRGFSANSILLVIDGVRMNNAIYRSGNLQNIISVDASDLESAEVLYGPGSVLYGSDALGGVINFSTFQPSYRTEGSSPVQAQAYMRFGSAMNEQTAHLDFNIGFKKVALHTSFTVSDFGDLKVGQNRPSNYGSLGLRSWQVQRINDRDSVVGNPEPHKMLGSGYNQVNFQQKISAKITHNLEWSYGLYYTTSSDIPRFDRLVELLPSGTPRSAEWYYGPQRWLMHRFQLHATNPSLLYKEAKLTLSNQSVEESRIDRNFNNARRRTQLEQVSIYTANLDFKKDLGEKSELYYGGEFLWNGVQSNAQRQHITSGEITYATSRYPDGGSTLSSYSAYAQAVHKPNEISTYSAGIRYNQNRLNASIQDTVFNFPFSEININSGALTGSIGTVVNYQKWRININLASGFRAPNVDDAAKVFESQPGNVVVPNGDLGPEYSYSAELGISRQVTDKLMLSGNVYYTLVNNAIEQRPFTFNGQTQVNFNGQLSTVNANVNVGEASIFGYTLEAIYDISHALAVRSSFTYTEGRDQTNSIPMRHIPPAFGRTVVIVKLNKWRTEFFSDYAGMKPFRGLPPEEQAKVNISYTSNGTPAWITFNVRSSYQINSYLQVQGALENITDRFYHPFAAGISAPGRNFILTLRGRF